MTTVGVTMSIYNGAATVGQALASVAAQTRLPDQIVVVDDGSDDGTPAVVEAWSAVLPMMTIVRHETNRGLAQGRMSGIQCLDTDVVLALDADDVWLPDHLALLLAAHERRPGIVSPMAVAWDPSSASPVNWQRRLQPLPKSLDLGHLLIMNFLFSGSLFERKAYEAAGGQYRFVDSNSPEDWDLWLRLTATGAQLSVLEVPTVLYRVHGSNMSADDRLLPMEIRVLEAFLAEHDDPALRAMAQRSLRHRRARAALRAAYEEARQHRPVAARRAALGALQGPAPVVRRAVAMMVAPAATSGWRDRARDMPGSGRLRWRLLRAGGVSAVRR